MGKTRREPMPRKVTYALARRLALALPGAQEATSYGTPSVKIAGKFLLRLREDGETLAVKIDFDTRDALLAADPRAFFVTDHYRGWPAVCVRLAAIDRKRLEAFLGEAWRFVAPKKLLASHGAR